MSKADNASFPNKHEAETVTVRCIHICPEHLGLAFTQSLSGQYDFRAISHLKRNEARHIAYRSKHSAVGHLIATTCSQVRSRLLRIGHAIVQNVPVRESWNHLFIGFESRMLHSQWPENV